MWARGSAIAYPVANLVHLLGLVLLVGGIGIVDLRFIGLFRAIPAPVLLRALRPLAAGGLLLVATSGTILFAADARSLVVNPMFQRKLAMIGLGLANILLFERLWRRGIDLWGRRIPTGVRLAGLVSLAAWLSAAAFGRLIAYV